MKTFPAFLLTTLALSLPARAHHGQEFFLLNDAKVQPPGHGLLQGTFSFADEGYADSLQLTPGVILGVLPRTALSVTANFTEEENESWRYRSVEPSILLDLTPKNFSLPVRFGVSFGYQFADGAAGGDLDDHGVTGVTGAALAHTHTEAELSSGSSSSGNTNGAPSGQSTTEAPHDHSTHDHGTTTTPAPGSGGGDNPDALTPEEIAAMGGGTTTPTTTTTPAASTPAATSSTNTATSKSKTSSKSKAKASANESAAHTHSSGTASDGHSHSHENSIHNHDDNLFTSRFTFEADLTKSTLLVGNLICSLPEGGSAAWGYGIGLRQRLRPGLAIGFEALGDFNRHGYQEALGAVYWEPMHHLTLKLGAGSGLSPTSPDATVRAGLIWMF